jgi:hypothetical protein
MKIPLYFLDNSWCFIEITINPDSEVLLDWTELETDIEAFIEGPTDTNILCLHDNRHCYYNPSKKEIFEFDHSINISMSLIIRNFNMLDRLAEINNLEKSEVEFSLD